MKCPNCNKEIIKAHHGGLRLYCNNFCRNEFQNKIIKNKIRKRNCLTCATEFEIGYKQQQKYCSVNCRPSVINPKPRICLICSISVSGKSRRRNYCDTCIPIKLQQVAEANRVHRPEQAEVTRKNKRHARERNAIGLNQHERGRLLKTWKSQQRNCLIATN